MSQFSPFSNWYPCDIQSDGHAFRCLEQAYQFRKAVYCGDTTSAVKLHHINSSQSQGTRVKNQRFRYN